MAIANAPYGATLWGRMGAIPVGQELVVREIVDQADVVWLLAAVAKFGLACQSCLAGTT